MYINYHNPRFIGSSIDTVECCKGMTRKERQILLSEYTKNDSNYYLSSRASKEYYHNKKVGNL